MILKNVKMAATDEPVDIQVINDKIAEISPSGKIQTGDILNLSFTNAIVFPGLINSHDHLDFNLFPQLGDKVYNNYTEWGHHIHATYKAEIEDISKIPALLRSQWGIYKNLLCGVTTVINHGERLKIENGLITVFEDTQCLHSVQFEKRWKIRLNNPFKIKLPVNIHVGEGDDWVSYNEIDRLTRWNLFKKKLVGVHAVAMSEEQAKKFEAVVWCPQSNFFLLNKTARINVLKDHTMLLFGTDSTLTSNWNIWQHLQSARGSMLVNDDILYRALNQNASKVWKLNTGEIAAGRDADIVVAKIKDNCTGLDAFFTLDPAHLLLVVHKGNIILFDESLLAQVKAVDLSRFSKIYIDGICKYVEGDLPGLIKKIREYYPKANFPVTTTKAA